MDKIIDLENYRQRMLAGARENDDNGRELSGEEVARLEALRDGVESLLDAVTARHCDPEAVAFAAGRYAAMRIYRLHGRAEAAVSRHATAGLRRRLRPRPHAGL